MKRVVVDTSVWIELSRGALSPAAARLGRLPADIDIVLSSVVAAELEVGPYLAQRPQRGQALLEQLSGAATKLDFGFDAARAYGRLVATLRESGKRIGAVDELIAAHALALDADIATLNAKDFSRIPGLRVQDWSR